MSKCLDDELYDIYIEDGKQVIESLREIYDKGRADAIDEFETKLVGRSWRLEESFNLLSVWALHGASR